MHLTDLMRADASRRTRRALRGALVAALALAAATLAPPSSAVEPYAWPESSPEAQGLDSHLLSLALEEAASRPYMYGLVVIRHGHLVAEGYFNGQTRYDANHIHSASKSFTSTLVGIAVDLGYLQSLDQKALDFFPEYVTADMDPRKHDITIRHLLMMKAGFDWDESEANWSVYWNSPDWVRYVLELPLRHDPGARFNYSTVQTNLLSAILTRATGMSTRAFAELFLFDPLQISIGYWHRDPQGYYTGGHEMYFTPRDMARLGYLYLGRGSVDGLEVVAPQWVEEATRRYADLSGRSPVADWGYGYQWWLGRLAGYPIFWADGKGGQFIVNFPDLDLIVVTTTNGDPWDYGVVVQADENMRLIANYVVPAVLDLPPPGELAAAVLSPTQVLVTWDDHSIDEEAFEVQLRGPAGPWREAVVVEADVERAVIGVLTPEATYQVRVRARGPDRVSEWCPEEAFTLPARLVRPNRVEARVLTARRVRLTWNDRSADEEAFEVEVQTVPGRWQQAATVDAGVTSLVLGGLTPETTYSFRVRAASSGGLSEWSPKPRLTLPVELARPDELRAVIISPRRVRLEWTDRSDGEDAFEVIVRTGSGRWARAATVGADVERVAISGLLPETTYRFRVRARSNVGMSSWSRVESVTTPAE